MSDGFKILRYDEAEWLDKNGSNWSFWKTRMVPYLKGSKLWPYVSEAVPKPMQTDVDKLENWETVDAQALSVKLSGAGERQKRSRIPLSIPIPLKQQLIHFIRTKTIKKIPISYFYFEYNFQTTIPQTTRVESSPHINTS